jgi:hypothetical protein
MNLLAKPAQAMPHLGGGSSSECLGASYDIGLGLQICKAALVGLDFLVVLDELPSERT